MFGTLLFSGSLFELWKSKMSVLPFLNQRNIPKTPFCPVIEKIKAKKYRQTKNALPLRTQVRTFRTDNRLSHHLKLTDQQWNS